MDNISAFSDKNFRITRVITGVNPPPALLAFNGNTSIANILQNAIQLGLGAIIEAIHPLSAICEEKHQAPLVIKKNFPDVIRIQPGLKNAQEIA